MRCRQRSTTWCNLLDLEPIEVNLFRGRSPDENRQRVFGGQVAGQALVAATRTIDEPDRFVHSLHAYFLRPGDPTVPILYEVDRIRDGKSFTTRRVVAHPARPGDLQPAGQLPHRTSPVPTTRSRCRRTCRTPRSLPDFKTRMAPYKDRMGEWYERHRPIDIRYIDGDPFSREGKPADRPAGVDARRRRAARRPDAARVHRHLRQRHDAARHHGVTVRPLVGKPRHADGQPRPRDVVPPTVPRRRLVAVRPGAISSGSGRGLAGGAIFTADGTLAVTVVQEGLARVGQSDERRADAPLRPRVAARRVAPRGACGSDDDEPIADRPRRSRSSPPHRPAPAHDRRHRRPAPSTTTSRPPAPDRRDRRHGADDRRRAATPCRHDGRPTRRPSRSAIRS